MPSTLEMACRCCIRTRGLLRVGVVRHRARRVRRPGFGAQLVLVGTGVGSAEEQLAAGGDDGHARCPGDRDLVDARRDCRGHLERSQALARGDEGFLLALGYSTQRGYGMTPTRRRWARCKP